MSLDIYRQNYFIKICIVMFAHIMKVANNIFNPVRYSKLCGDLFEVYYTVYSEPRNVNTKDLEEK